MKLIKPTLTISGYAWNKIMFLNSCSDNEYGAFCITHPNDPLYIEDFELTEQEVTSVTVELDDDSQADYVDRMVNEGLKLENFYRIWMHTHPSSVKTPSSTDEKNFQRTLAECDWAIMLIVTKDGDIYAKLHHAFPETEVLLDVKIDYSNDRPTDPEKWLQEFDENVEEEVLLVQTATSQNKFINCNQTNFIDYDEIPQAQYHDLLSYEDAIHAAYCSGELSEENYDRMSIEIWQHQTISSEILAIATKYVQKGMYG